MTVPTSADRSAAIRHAQRASGQLAALAPMIAASQPFPQVAQQLLAARGSLDSLLVRLVELELHDCLPSREARAEVDGLLRTALGRSASRRGSLAIHRRTTAQTSIALQGRTTR
ncbi:MAG: metal-sensing transcriptional repressor [Chloroflexi bacterium]|nr:metal-sensing transcriptional repressor [Chloroflexota bacterium]